MNNLKQRANNKAIYELSRRFKNIDLRTGIHKGREIYNEGIEKYKELLYTRTYSPKIKEDEIITVEEAEDAPRLFVDKGDNR